MRQTHVEKSKAPKMKRYIENPFFMFRHCTIAPPVAYYGG